ncbi:MAG: exodeoxyribonuclease V subunit gamma [Lentisphaeria bacterium]|nr:exodeoxyribonuclease V subunit gamma [Lentisphaeria bacterium]
MENIPHLTIYRSTSVNSLADRLMDNSEPELCGGDIFHRLSIIVPNKSAARYLTLRFARRFGIAAGIEFPFLMSIFKRSAFKEKDADREQESPAGDAEIDPVIIGWRIFRDLPSLLEQDKYAYLKNRLEDSDQMRRWYFGQEMGKIYDRYMLYRPKWINKWEREPSAGDNWQAELWKDVSKDWAGQHFAALYEQICADTLIPRQDGTIRIFGFSAIPPAVLECLEAISRYRPVELYHFVPNREFFGTGKTAKEELREFIRLCFEQEKSGKSVDGLQNYYFQHHPLAASFAAQARNLLNGTIEWEEGPLDPAEIGEDTLLHRLQKKITEDDTSAGPEQENPCPSVQFRNCFSPFREVETAHNFLLHCFEELRGLTLNDILVMTPDPAKFAPIVDAVFNHSGEARLPVSIADRNPADEQPAFNTLLKTLQLYRGQFTMSDVSAVLQDRQVQKHLGVTPEECRFFLDRAAAAGIRWGFDADEHSRLGGVAFAGSDWQSGLDRLLLNWAMDSDPAEPVTLNTDTIFPVPGFSDNGAVLGKFAVFVKKLHDRAVRMRARQTEGVPFGEWKQFLTETAAELFGDDSELTLPLLKELRKHERELAAAKAEKLPLTSELIVQLLSGLTGKAEDSSKGFLRGRITFCGLRPMRDIPARVIVLLGMNHDAFPSAEPKQEFDLIRSDFQTGDPSLREDERQLFLDLILCAGDRLYISYTGRNNHDDHKRFPPSVCVEELRSYLKTAFGPTSFVDLEEPLHSFSAVLFRPDRADQSYSAALRDAAKTIAGRSSEELRPLFSPGEAGEPDDPEFYRITADQLISFFRNPANHFLTKRLHTRVSVKELTSSEDFEPFTPEYLPYEEKDRLLERCIGASPEEQERLKAVSLARFKADSILPYRLESEWPEWDNITGLAGRIPPQTAVRNGRAADLTLSGGRVITLLIPEIKTDSGGTQYFPCYGSDLNGHGLIKGIILHLAANLSEPTPTRLVLTKKCYQADPMPAEEAEKQLKTVLELYLEGLKAPLPFFPETSCRMVFPDDSDPWEDEAHKFADVFGEEKPGGSKVQEIAEKFYRAAVFNDVTEEE